MGEAGRGHADEEDSPVPSAASSTSSSSGYLGPAAGSTRCLLVIGRVAIKLESAGRGRLRPASRPVRRKRLPSMC